MTNDKTDVNSQIGIAYKKATGNNIDNAKTIILKRLYDASIDKLKNGQSNGSIRRMLSDSSATNEMIYLAAMSVVTNAILNLDEVITKNHP